jgi:hypothetical protein
MGWQTLAGFAPFFAAKDGGKAGEGSNVAIEFTQMTTAVRHAHFYCKKWMAV